MPASEAMDDEASDQVYLRHLRPIQITKNRFIMWTSTWAIAESALAALILVAAPALWKLIGLIPATFAAVHIAAIRATWRSSPAFDGVFPGLLYWDPRRSFVWFFEHALERTGSPADPNSDMGPDWYGAFSPERIAEVRYAADRAVIIRKPIQVNARQERLATATALATGPLAIAGGVTASTLIEGDGGLLLGFVLIFFGAAFEVIGIWNLTTGLRSRRTASRQGEVDASPSDEGIASKSSAEGDKSRHL